MSVQHWQKEPPSQPGYYWFHGWPYSPLSKRREQPELCLVEVRHGTNSSRLILITNGQFVYMASMLGLWQPANLPELPDSIWEILEGD